MLRLARALWADQNGFILSAELVIVATTLILGLTVALVAVRDSIAGELSDIAQAFRGLDQSYYISGFRGCRKANGTSSSWTAGSAFFDPHLRTSGPQQDFFPEEIVLGGTECPLPQRSPVACLPAERPCPPPQLDCPPSLPEPCGPCEIPAVPEQILNGQCLQPEHAPCAQPCTEPRPQPCSSPCTETVIPCFSCCPGTNGHLAPTPLSPMPCCVGSQRGEAVVTHEYGRYGQWNNFTPTCYPYPAVPTGPLQVW